MSWEASLVYMVSSIQNSQGYAERPCFRTKQREQAEQAMESKHRSHGLPISSCLQVLVLTSSSQHSNPKTSCEVIMCS